MFTTTHPKTLPGLITALRKPPSKGTTTDEELEHILDLHYEAWDRHRWFFGSVLGWGIYQHQLFEVPDDRHDRLKETNPDLYQRYDDEFMRCCYYFDDIIVPSIWFPLSLRVSSLAYKLKGSRTENEDIIYSN